MEFGHNKCHPQRHSKASLSRWETLSNYQTFEMYRRRFLRRNNHLRLLQRDFHVGTFGKSRPTNAASHPHRFIHKSIHSDIENPWCSMDLNRAGRRAMQNDHGSDETKMFSIRCSVDRHFPFEQCRSMILLWMIWIVIHSFLIETNEIIIELTTIEEEIYNNNGNMSSFDWLVDSIALENHVTSRRPRWTDLHYSHRTKCTCCHSLLVSIVLVLADSILPVFHLSGRVSCQPFRFPCSFLRCYCNVQNKIIDLCVWEISNINSAQQVENTARFCRNSGKWIPDSDCAWEDPRGTVYQTRSMNSRFDSISPAPILWF